MVEPYASLPSSFKGKKEELARFCYHGAMRLVWLIASTSALASIAAAVSADLFLQGRIALLGSFAGLLYTRNPGIAFGVRFAPVVQSLLIGLALLCVLWLAVRTVRFRARAGLPVIRWQLAYGLILGGGVANIVDRLRDGLVTDFFQIGGFPIFNVADSCITVGVVLLLWETLMPKNAL